MNEEDFVDDGEGLQGECKTRKIDGEGRVIKSDSAKKPRGVRGEQVEGGGIRCKHCGVVCADAQGLLPLQDQEVPTL